MTDYTPDSSLVDISNDISSREILYSLGDLLANRMLPYDAYFNSDESDFTKAELLEVSKALDFWMVNIKLVQAKFQQRFESMYRLGF